MNKKLVNFDRKHFMFDFKCSCDSIIIFNVKKESVIVGEKNKLKCRNCEKDINYIFGDNKNVIFE